MKLASSASFETTHMSSTAAAARLASLLPPATRVSVTHLPSSTFLETIDTCQLLKQQGLYPIPTFCARSFRNKNDFKQSLEMLQDQLDGSIDQAFVFAGSRQEPLGELTSSIDLLETGLLQEFQIRTVGVAGHPEGLPGVDNAELQAALAFKNSFARDTGMNVFLVTQFCFETDAIVQWEERIRAEGNRLDIRVGVPGLASVSTLLRHSLACGVGPSMRVLQQKGGDLTKLRNPPNQQLLDLAKYKASNPECTLQSIHWYPFGALENTAEFSNSIANGNFDIGENGERLQVF